MGQQLTALRLHLDLISRHIDDEGAEHVDQAKVLVAGVIRDVRGVVTHLRNGHVKARDEIARLARSLPRPETSLDLDPAIDEAPQPVAISLVRVVQEGLTNVARHSQAKHAWVRITREAVSYTHLDVYKRQTLRWAAPAAGGFQLMAHIPLGENLL